MSLISEIKWTKPFQKPPAAFGIPSTGPKGQLMVRPQFPQVFREKQLSDVSTNSQLEVTVVVNDVWKVGDLVDWWKDNCYWSGKIIAILGDEEVKVLLFTYSHRLRLSTVFIANLFLINLIMVDLVQFLTKCSA